MTPLEYIVSEDVLRRIWKQMRKQELEVHLTFAPLVRDCAGGIAFELTIKDVLAYLRARILDGSYEPDPPLVIEAAKSKLLHRTLFFLMPEDALILCALVAAIQPYLQESMPPWVSFGREDHTAQTPKKTKQPIIGFDYEGWWPRWLKLRKLTTAIEEDGNPFIVTTDIVNFFGSIDLSSLRSQLNALVNLVDSRANDLLFFILDRLHPTTSYRPSAPRGLPVVEADASRILASFYLNKVDKELQQEGQEGRYTRWVDDMVVSVADEMEGAKVVARVERALAGLGLVANSSKTDIVTKSQFREWHYEEENQYLDKVHARTDKGGFPPLRLQQFDERLARFLDLRREGYWAQILKRYYTESRRVRSRLLLDRWHLHLKDFPQHARHILDYVAFSAGNYDTCRRLFDFLKDYGATHQDVCILLYEALLQAPFPNEASISNYVVSNTYNHFRGGGGFEKPCSYVLGLQALTLYKFGSEAELSPLAEDFTALALRNPEFTPYAFVVLAACNRFRSLAENGVEHMRDPRLLRLRALVSRLEKGDAQAINLLRGLTRPKLTKHPTRAVVNPRSLPLLAIGLRSRQGSRSNALFGAVELAIKTVRDKTEEATLVDEVSLAHLKVLLEAKIPVSVGQASES